MAFVADLEQDVVQVVHGVDHPSDVRLLKCRDLDVGQLVRLLTAVIPVQVAIDAIDVVGGLEGVSSPRIVRTEAALVLHRAPAVEQHDRHVDSTLTGGHHPRPEPGEVRLVELRKVVSGPAVLRRPRARPAVRRRGVEPIVVVGSLHGPPTGFPGPEPEEVVVVGREGVEVGRVVEDRGRVGPAVVLQIAPGVRAGEQDRGAVFVGEVARIARADAQQAQRRTGRAVHGNERGPARFTAGRGNLRRTARPRGHQAGPVDRRHRRVVRRPADGPVQQLVPGRVEDVGRQPHRVADIELGGARRDLNRRSLHLVYDDRRANTVAIAARENRQHDDSHRSDETPSIQHFHGFLPPSHQVRHARSRDSPSTTHPRQSAAPSRDASPNALGALGARFGQKETTHGTSSWRHPLPRSGPLGFGYASRQPHRGAPLPHAASRLNRKKPGAGAQARRPPSVSASDRAIPAPARFDPYCSPKA